MFLGVMFFTLLSKVVSWFWFLDKMTYSPTPDELLSLTYCFPSDYIARKTGSFAVNVFALIGARITKTYPIPWNVCSRNLGSATLTSAIFIWDLAVVNFPSPIKSFVTKLLIIDATTKCKFGTEVRQRKISLTYTLVCKCCWQNASEST